MPREGTKWDGEDKRTYRWKCLVSIAWVAVGWQQGVVQNTRQSQRELGNDQGSTVFFVFLFFFCGHTVAGGSRESCQMPRGVESLNSAHGGFYVIA